MFSTYLKNDTFFFCAADDTILVGAEKANINLAYSCKTGRCKTCKAKVLDGSSIAISEEIGLSAEEKKEGYILTCVRKPTSDLTLDIEDLSGYAIEPIRTLPSKVDALLKLSQDAIELRLRLPPQSNFTYLPGQYINIIKGDYKRSYSIATHDSTNGIVLYIKNYPGGKFSNYLFNEAKTNDLLRIEGPLGSFFFRKTTKTNIIFLATGTGIAPVKAMLENLDKNHTDVFGKTIYLFFGGRIQEDLFWKPNFKNIQVHYIPVLSRTTPNWNGATGYIQNAIMQNDIELAESVIYACGSENMIQDAFDLTRVNGLSEDAFFSDAFISNK